MLTQQFEALGRNVFDHRHKRTHDLKGCLPLSLSVCVCWCFKDFKSFSYLLQNDFVAPKRKQNENATDVILIVWCDKISQLPHLFKLELTASVFIVFLDVLCHLHSGNCSKAHSLKVHKILSIPFSDIQQTRLFFYLIDDLNSFCPADKVLIK